MRGRRGIAALLVGAAVVATWSAAELSGQTASSSAKIKYLPPWQQAPSGFCANRNVKRAFAYAPKRKFVVYETSGDARGPHIFTASVASSAYYCVDGRAQANWAFQWDMSNILGTTITAQVHIRRADGTARASKIFDLPPKSAWRCCDDAHYLPTLEFPRSLSPLATIDIKPLFNRNPTIYSAADTKGGLQANYSRPR